jgi:hypothetical protein
MDSIGELHPVTGCLIGAHARDPHGQLEAGDHPRSVPCGRGDDDRDRGKMSHDALDIARHEVREMNVAIAIIVGKDLSIAGVGATWLSRGCDPGEHLHRLNRELPHRRFFRKHHTIGAVEDGIGDIGGFRPGWVNTPWRTKRLNDSLMIASALQTKNTFINMKNLHLILSY